MLTTEAVIRAGHETVRKCPRCTQLRWDLEQAHRNLRRKWFRTRYLWVRYGARPEELEPLDARWAGYARRAKQAAQIEVCTHDSWVVDLTPRRTSYVEPEQPKLGADQSKDDPAAIRDSALSEWLTLQDRAFAWEALGYDPLADLSEHHERASTFELVAQGNAEDRMWIEDLDEHDWRRIHKYCDSEPRWYIEAEDRYAEQHFLEKYLQGEIRDDPRDHPARDKLAALRRRHQGMQVVAELRRQWQSSPHRNVLWLTPNSRLASHDTARLSDEEFPFTEWVREWAPDAIAEVQHALTMADRRGREPCLILRPKERKLTIEGVEHTLPGKTAIWRIYQDEPLSELERAILKDDARAKYAQAHGHRPDNVYVNTNYVELELVEGATSELPDELMEAPEEAYAE